MADVTAAGLQALAKAVRERRRELRLDAAKDLALRADVSLRTVGEVERGGSLVGPRSRERLEEALQWEPGTMLAIATGEVSPSTAVAAPAEDLAALTRELRAALERLDQVRGDVERLLDRLPNQG